MYHLTAEKFEQYRNSLKIYTDCWIKMCESSCNPLSIALVVLDSAILFTLPVGGWLYLRDSLSAASYLLFILLTMCFFTSFLNMVTIAMQSMELGSGLDNVKKIMDMETMKSLLSSDSLVREVSLGGRTIDGNVQFFYALIAMACLYGCFIGFGSAIGIQANITPLAARRCVTPTHKLKLILTDQLTSFALGYVDVIILILYLRYILNLDFQGQMGKMLVVSFFGSLIGVSMGMFIGSFGKMQEGVRIGLMLGISMASSFLAGLMNGNMKDIVEKSVPFVNRINPASLISDAFYCINVYDDMTRYYRNLITLAVMCVVLVMASFFMVRRERYDSI